MESPIDIILLTHNKLDNTTRCIEALYANTQVPFKLTVIDDSTDLTPSYFEWLNKERGNVNYVRPDVFIRNANQAVNIGISLTQSDPFIFLCNSSFVEPDWLITALQIMQHDPKVGVVGFKLLFPDTNMIIEAGEIVMPDAFRPNAGMYEPSHRYTHIREVKAIGWACVLIRRAAIPEGGLDENVYPVGFRGPEDTDNCLEMKKRGWTIWYNGYGTVYHKLSQSQGGGSEQGRKEATECYKLFVKKWKGRVP